MKHTIGLFLLVFGARLISNAAPPDYAVNWNIVCVSWLVGLALILPRLRRLLSGLFENETEFRYINAAPKPQPPAQKQRPSAPAAYMDEKGSLQNLFVHRDESGNITQTMNWDDPNSTWNVNDNWRFE